ncbi:MAG: hypothetical protein ABIR29_05815 [Chthoniobacterales bacterium]
MKRKSLAAFFIGLPLAVGLLLHGCATPTASSKSNQALVCPQCKMVETDYYEEESGLQSTALAHQCPGCQGVLMSLLHKGKWEHKCSICAERAFVCPVVHPST